MFILTTFNFNNVAELQVSCRNDESSRVFLGIRMGCFASKDACKYMVKITFLMVLFMK